MKYSDIVVPQWCGLDCEPNHPYGCWSLISGLIKEIEFCKTCDCFKPGEYKFKHILAVTECQEKLFEERLANEQL
jgi:hypothetical protein